MHLLISDYLLIVGGQDSAGKVDAVELVSLNSDTIPNCLRSLNDFPVEMRAAVGTTMIGECNTITILTHGVSYYSWKSGAGLHLVPVYL